MAFQGKIKVGNTRPLNGTQRKRLPFFQREGAKQVLNVFLKALLANVPAIGYRVTTISSKATSGNTNAGWGLATFVFVDVDKAKHTVDGFSVEFLGREYGFGALVFFDVHA
jgi:hypothetical protein